MVASASAADQAINVHLNDKVPAGQQPSLLDDFPLELAMKLNAFPVHKHEFEAIDRVGPNT